MSRINFQSFHIPKKSNELEEFAKLTEESKGRSLQAKNIKKNIHEIFKCLICFNNISKDAMLCPHCSKLWCNTCITKWLTERKSECPHCRTPLTTRQLVNCRFASDVSDAIKDLADIKSIEDEDENCGEHGTELKYFCKTCVVPICSDCAMFGTKHRDHQFEKLIEVYHAHLSKIKIEKEVLDDKLGEMNSRLHKIDKCIDTITKAKEEKLKEIDKFVDEVHKKLEMQMKDKVINLLSSKEHLNEDICKLEECHCEIIHQIETLPKPKLISKSDQMVSYIRAISSQITSQKSSFDMVSADFDSEIAPEYSIGEFEIQNYLELKNETEIMYSEPISNFGITWRLKVYPNGNGQAKDNYLSVFLEMLKGYSDSAKYDYKIEMEHPSNSEGKVSREYTSEFEAGECWGYNRFYKSESVQQEGFVSGSGSIKLKFYVKASTYSQQCADQQRYIEELEAKIEHMKTKLNDNNIVYNEDSNQQDEEEDIDNLPINEIKDNKEESSEDEYREPQTEIKHSLVNNLFSNEDAKQEQDRIQDDSFQTEEPFELSNNEQSHHNYFERKHNRSGEIEDHIDGFKYDYNADSDVNYMLLRELNRLGIELTPNAFSPNTAQEYTHADDLIKELNDTEQQFKMLEIYNKSFNKDMSERYGIYDSHSDDHLDRDDPLSSDTSEGNLSRNEELKDDEVKFELLQVSPDSPIESETGFAQDIKRELNKYKNDIESENSQNIDYNSIRSENIDKLIIRKLFKK